MAFINIFVFDCCIVLVDYIEVLIMVEVFNEIIIGVILWKSGGVIWFSVFNLEDQEWVDYLLVLLDNVLVYDIEVLLEIDLAVVEAVEVFYFDYIIGDFIVEVIVVIKI